MTSRIRPVALVLLLSAAFLAPAAGPACAQKTTIEELCRLHGLDQASGVSAVRSAFNEALASGISEDELFPFVEDILRHKLDCPQMVRVLSVTTKLRRADLPYFVVFSKVREGVAKEAPPALLVEAAESKYATLTRSRDVLRSLESSGYAVRDYQNAAVIVASYIERGYTVDEVVQQIRNKGIEGAGFTALSGVLEKPVRRKER